MASGNQEHGWPEKMSGYLFHDIYLSNDPSRYPMARGLRSPVTPAFQRPAGVSEIPASLHQDAVALLACVEASFMEKGEAEFDVKFDEVKYRCALIAPSSDTPLLRSPQTRREWCVRQVGSRPPDVEQLSLPQDVVDALRAAGVERGLTIIAGSFGSGKTTTASAALLDWVCKNRESAVTFEDPPEFPLDGRYKGGGIIHQIRVDRTTLASSIVNARRWAPRYVFLGEIRTPEAAAELLHLAISGPMSLCTVHGSDIIQSIASLARYAGPVMGEEEARRMIASSLRLVVHQDLSWGQMIARKAVFPAQGCQAMRQKIEAGKFGMLQEDFERQAAWG